MFPSGKPVIGRLINTAAGTVQAIVFRDIQGNVHTFAAGERLIVYTVAVNNRATAKDLMVFQDNDADGAVDAGEEIAPFTFAATGTEQVEFSQGMGTKRITTAATNTFKALASTTGAVDVVVVGEVVNS